MVFKAEQECPQCGASLEMEETDHLLDCPYCNTTSYLSAPDYFRFVLPHDRDDQDIVYVPYLRFRGSVFSCHGTTIKHRIADITQLGTPLTILPPSLGLRPQAMKLRFATPESAGTYLKNFIDVDKALKNITTYTDIPDVTFHEAHIGEAVSIIYLPLAIKNAVVHDAITDDALAKLPQDKDIFARVRDDHKAWQITSFATLCPQCGWDLEGTKGSVALTCDNCKTVWQATKNGFSRISFTVYQPNNLSQNTIFMPFWRMKASSKGIAIKSFADFIRVTNQPRVPRKEWEDIPMVFWSPAFKIRPKIFLQLASQLTNSQKSLKQADSLQPGATLYPVTLPCSEAVQSLKIILANTATGKKKIMPLLPATQFSIADISLAYVPFSDRGYNLFQDDTRANLNKKVLEWASRL